LGRKWALDDTWGLGFFPGSGDGTGPRVSAQALAGAIDALVFSIRPKKKTAAAVNGHPNWQGARDISAVIGRRTGASDGRNRNGWAPRKEFSGQGDGKSAGNLGEPRHGRALGFELSNRGLENCIGEPASFEPGPTHLATYKLISFSIRSMSGSGTA